VLFVFAYRDTEANMYLQEDALSGLHLKPCRAEPGVEPTVSPDGIKVCFVIDTAAGGSYVTFSRPGFAYQINVNAEPTVTTDAQKSVLLGIVDQLRPV